MPGVSSGTRCSAGAGNNVTESVAGQTESLRYSGMRACQSGGIILIKLVINRWEHGLFPSESESESVQILVRGSCVAGPNK